MKFFISHKQEDRGVALLIAWELRSLQIEYYLDTLDDTVAESGRELTEHIKQELNDCTDILVIMSRATRLSQWVPFEVGVAAQRDLPTATFLRAEVELPKFLEYWPRLTSTEQIHDYVAVRQAVDLEYSKLSHMQQYLMSESKTDRFYSALKRRLG